LVDQFAVVILARSFRALFAPGLQNLSLATRTASSALDRTWLFI